MARYAYYKSGVVFEICSKQNSYLDSNSISFVEITSENSPYFTLEFKKEGESTYDKSKTYDLSYLISDGDSYSNGKFTPLVGDSYWNLKMEEFSKKFKQNIERGVVLEVPFYYESQTGKITANTISLVREYGLESGATYDYKVSITNDANSYNGFNGDTLVKEVAEKSALEILNAYDSNMEWSVTIEGTMKDEDDNTAQAPGTRPPMGDDSWGDDETNSGTTEDSGSTENSGTTEDSGTTESTPTYVEFHKILTLNEYEIDWVLYQFNDDATTSATEGEMWFVNMLNQFCFVEKVKGPDSYGDVYKCYANTGLTFTNGMVYRISMYASPAVQNSNGETVDYIYQNKEDGKNYKWSKNGLLLEV